MLEIKIHTMNEGRVLDRDYTADISFSRDKSSYDLLAKDLFAYSLIESRVVKMIDEVNALMNEHYEEFMSMDLNPRYYIGSNKYEVVKFYSADLKHCDPHFFFRNAESALLASGLFRSITKTLNDLDFDYGLSTACIERFREKFAREITALFLNLIKEELDKTE